MWFITRYPFLAALLVAISIGLFWYAKQLKPWLTVRIPWIASEALFSPNGQTLVVIRDLPPGWVGAPHFAAGFVIETSTGKEMAQFGFSQYMFQFAVFRPDGRFLVSYDPLDRLQLWDTETWEEVSTEFRMDGFVNEVEYSAYGDVFAYSACASGGCSGVYIYERSGPNLIRIFTDYDYSSSEQDNGIAWLAFSPDSNLIAISYSPSKVGGTTHIRDIQSGVILASLEQPGRLYGTAWSPDARFVAVGSEDGTVHIWEVDAGIEVTRLEHDGIAAPRSFSSDSRFLVVNVGIDARKDDYVVLWDSVNWERVATFDRDVESIQFVEDDAYVISVSGDTVSVYNLSDFVNL